LKKKEEEIFIANNSLIQKNNDIERATLQLNTIINHLQVPKITLLIDTKFETFHKSKTLNHQTKSNESNDVELFNETLTKTKKSYQRIVNQTLYFKRITKEKKKEIDDIKTELSNSAIKLKSKNNSLPSSSDLTTFHTHNNFSIKSIQMQKEELLKLKENEKEEKQRKKEKKEKRVFAMKTLKDLKKELANNKKKKKCFGKIGK